MTSEFDAIVIGGGLAGLACARELCRQGLSCRLLEASDQIGGRVSTDEVDGFLLDRGFQVFLTSYPEDEDVFAAIKGGAMGVLLKDSPPDNLLQAVRTVYAGDSALHPAIARTLMLELKRPPALAQGQEPLTARELDVLRCLARGMPNREIANELSVSTRTVTTHVRHILDKLHLENRTQAALYAVEHGIVPRQRP